MSRSPVFLLIQWNWPMWQLAELAKYTAYKERSLYAIQLGYIMQLKKAETARWGLKWLLCNIQHFSANWYSFWSFCQSPYRQIALAPKTTEIIRNAYNKNTFVLSLANHFNRDWWKTFQLWSLKGKTRTFLFSDNSLKIPEIWFLSLVIKPGNPQCFNGPWLLQINYRQAHNTGKKSSQSKRLFENYLC